MNVSDRIWYGSRRSDRLARSALMPLAVVFGRVVSARNALFDRGLLRQHAGELPTLSVGNLSVGGTGKTPLAAWFAHQLCSRGARPAIVLRGYGEDEPAVHRQLNPEVEVVVDTNRTRGIASAARSGCDVAVLDDGFQHRTAARIEDVVLISADRWRDPVRLLPAGPWREPVSSLRRATLLLVTRKTASRDVSLSLLSTLAPITKSGAGAAVELQIDGMHEVLGTRWESAHQLAGMRALVVAGIADPMGFATQLRAGGMDVEVMAFPDHHRYTRADVSRIARRATAFGRAACTLKDAVKLQSMWPRNGVPLWYFSQRVEVEHGNEALEGVLRRLLAARPRTPPITAG
jgi:tetraacyldisaccharide 4'-kinase